MKKLLPFLAIFMFLFQACGGGASAPVATVAPANVQPTDVTITEAPTAEPIVHTTIPQAGTVSRANAHDREESTIFDRKDVVFGDDFKNNQFERPFTANDMNYLPDLDIVDFGITSDDTFFYIKIILSGLDPAAQAPTGSYGVEIDRNGDGRGEIFLAAHGPYSTDFTPDTVVVYVDQDGDIGGSHPGLPDETFNGNGYDGVIYDLRHGIHPEDPDLAWVHFVPGDKPAIEIAYKKWIFKGGNERFMWSVWASSQELNPVAFNLHDRFTLEAAGSPTKTDPNYPIKVISEIDNSCRVPFGFSATGAEPLGCDVQVAAAQVQEENGVDFCTQFPAVCNKGNQNTNTGNRQAIIVTIDTDIPFFGPFGPPNLEGGLP